MEEFLKIGVITTTHGIRGEVKVFPTTDDPARFGKLKCLYLQSGRERMELEVQGVKFFKNLVILKFRGLDSINEVERYRGCGLYVSRDQAVPLEENEYYIADLLDMEVYTEDGSLLGRLTDVIETGANDVYCVDTPQYGEILIPAIRQCILRVDVEAGRMTVNLLPGLLPDLQKK
jgi:16S rRNA processing protein RimM